MSLQLFDALPAHIEAAPSTWAELRAITLYRDGYLCQLCKQAEATEADHIWPRALGGEDRLDNLQASCGPCNRRKGAVPDFLSLTRAQLTYGAARLDYLSSLVRDDLALNDRLRALLDAAPGASTPREAAAQLGTTIEAWLLGDAA